MSVAQPMTEPVEMFENNKYAAVLRTWRLPTNLAPPAAHSLEALRLFHRNPSTVALKTVAANYDSLWRPIPHLSVRLPVVAWLYLRGRPPATGTPVNGLTGQLDKDGLVLNLRVPEMAWLAALLTLRMSLRMGISLPYGRGRVVANGVTLWAESYLPNEPLKLGVAFTEISELDRKRIRRVVACERRRQAWLRPPAGTSSPWTSASPDGERSAASESLRSASCGQAGA